MKYFITKIIHFVIKSVVGRDQYSYNGVVVGYTN